MNWRWEMYRMLTRPAMITIKPYQGCNFHCEYCSMDLGNDNWRKSGVMTARNWMDILDQRQERLVNICGGEPLIYFMISPLIKRIIASGRLCVLTTNLSNYGLIPSHWRFIIHATYHPTQISREQFMDNVRRYRSDGHHVGIYEIGQKTLPGSRIKPMQTRANFKPITTIGADGTVYENCYLR